MNIKTDLDFLFNELQKITVKKSSLTSTRSGFEIHRSMSFGLTRHRFKGRNLKPSYASTRYPHIHKLIFEIGDRYCPHPFTSVHLNHNVTCPPHIDADNVGISTVLSFGDYTGGTLVVEGEIRDAYCNPVTFDGSKLMHWNTADLVGNKYSLVFYNKS
jgi:hypothetical protein